MKNILNTLLIVALFLFTSSLHLKNKVVSKGQAYALENNGNCIKYALRSVALTYGPCETFATHNYWYFAKTADGSYNIKSAADTFQVFNIYSAWTGDNVQVYGYDLHDGTNEITFQLINRMKITPNFQSSMWGKRL
jgi:hypothetical protein